eukprot:13612417-Ditylum_brightwellii.AAC.1
MAIDVGIKMVFHHSESHCLVSIVLATHSAQIWRELDNIVVTTDNISLAFSMCLLHSNPGEISGGGGGSFVGPRPKDT